MNDYFDFISEGETDDSRRGTENSIVLASYVS
jgi:hypothetical protein